MVAKLKEKDIQNLTLMSLNVEPCQLGPLWLMALPSEHCHNGDVLMAAKLMKSHTEPNPNESQCGTLSAGPIWLMNLPSEHCHTGGVFMESKFRKNTDRT